MATPACQQAGIFTDHGYIKTSLGLVFFYLSIEGEDIYPHLQGFGDYIFETSKSNKTSGFMLVVFRFKSMRTRRW